MSSFREQMFDRATSFDLDHARDHRYDDHSRARLVLRGPGLWAVEYLGEVLNSKGKWEWEPSPSSRTDKFKGRTRFELERALRLAHEAGLLDEIPSNEERNLHS